MLETHDLPAPEQQHPSFRAVLSNPDFMFLWLAQVFSQLADKVILVYLIVLLGVAGYTANSDTSRLTLVFTIPAVIFGSIAGVYVDRWNKKWLMIASNVLRAVFALALPIALWFQPPSALWIYAMTFLVSTSTQFFAPAEIAMIPVVIEKRHLLAANSLFTTTMLGSVVIGMGVAEPIIHRFGDHLYGHLAIGGMYIISTVFLLFVSMRFKSPAPEQAASAGASSVLKELKEGFDYVLKDPDVRFLLLRLILLFSAFAALTVLVIGFVNDVLQLEKRYFGYLLAASGLGMGISAAVVGRFGARLGKERLISGGFIAMGLLLMALANLNWFTSLLNVASKAGSASVIEIGLAFALAFMLGLPAAAIAVPIQTMLQEEIPENMRGKVFGVQNMLINVANTLPLAMAGVLADGLDDRFPGYGVVLVMNLVGLILLVGAFLRRQSQTLAAK